MDLLLVATFTSQPAHLEPDHRPIVMVEITGRYNKTDMDAAITLSLHPESAGELIVGLQKALVSLAMEQRGGEE